MYNPHPRTKTMLDRAMQYINSVPYQVNARWVFYRLLQDGYYKDKKDYKNKFMDPLASARMECFGEWRPWTLADETRTPIYRGYNKGYKDPVEWLEALGKMECDLCKWHFRPTYLELWYEARAMTAQFEHYTKDITLRPMGGQPSIPFKWQIAQHFSNIREMFPDKDIAVLYFGDLDKAGFDIMNSVLNDVRGWCNSLEIKFEFYRAGLNDDQQDEFNVTENFEHPGYQWEALTDDAARTIIERALVKYPDNDGTLFRRRKESHGTVPIAVASVYDGNGDDLDVRQFNSQRGL